MKKRSVKIKGHLTSVSLEEEFWTALKDIAENEGISINSLVEHVDTDRKENLSSALRLFVLNHYQKR